MCLMMDVCSRGSSTGWLTRASIALILRVACPSPRLADGAALGRAPPSSGSMLDASSRAGAFSASVTGMSKTAVARISNVTEMCSARVSVTRLLSRSRSWAWRSATEPHEGFDWLAPSNASMVGRRSVPSRRSGRGRGVHPGFGMDGWTRFRSRLVLAGSFRSRRRGRDGPARGCAVAEVLGSWRCRELHVLLLQQSRENPRVVFPTRIGGNGWSLNAACVGLCRCGGGLYIHTV